MRSPLSNRLTIAAFIAALGLPFAATVGGVGTGRAAGETAADDAAKTGPWARMDAFNSHFGLRSLLIHGHALALTALHASPSPTVIRGRDGWLYYADDSAIEDYVSATPLSSEDLTAWRTAVVATRDALRARGVAYVLTFAPDKHVIYPEHLPETVHRLRSQYRFEQLSAYLRATTDVEVVDLETPLRTAKGGEQVYYRTDTHWNDAGAFTGYTALLTAAARQLPGLEVLPRCAFKTSTATEPGHDLAVMLGIETAVTEQVTHLTPEAGWRARILEPETMREGFDVARVVTEIPGSSAPRVVVFRDSFGTGLVRFVSESFRRAVYMWQNEVDMDIVAQEKPALVIQEIVGRRLQTYVPYQ